MKYSILVLVLIFSVKGYSQLQGIVLSNETLSPIPYTNIWIENEDIGTTSDVNGKFRFNENHSNKKLIVSAIGYESLSLPIDSFFLQIKLVPKIYQISEVNVNPNQKKEELIMSHLEKQSSFCGIMTPQIFARYFPFKSEYMNTPFIKSIKLRTRSLKIESCFNLRFLTVNENGEPGEDILSDNLIVNVKRGVKNTAIKNFNNTTISIPEKGLFVAIEFLIIEKNAIRLKGKEVNTGEINEITCFMPLIAGQKNNDTVNGWVYNRGKWMDNGFGSIFRDTHKKNENYCIAMEVVLNN